MTAAMKRDRLLAYLAGADDKKVKALYSLLEQSINDCGTPSVFTEKQIEILDERRTSYLSGNVAGIEWQKMHTNIRERRKATR